MLGQYQSLPNQKNINYVSFSGRLSSDSKLQNVLKGIVISYVFLNALMGLTSCTQLEKNVCKGYLPAVMFHLSLWYMLTLQILALVVLTVGNDWRSWRRMDNRRCGGEMSMRWRSVLHRVWVKVVLPWAVCLWTLVTNTCRRKIILYFFNLTAVYL